MCQSSSKIRTRIFDGFEIRLHYWIFARRMKRSRWMSAENSNQWIQKSNFRRIDWENFNGEYLQCATWSQTEDQNEKKWNCMTFKLGTAKFLESKIWSFVKSYTFVYSLHTFEVFFRKDGIRLSYNRYIVRIFFYSSKTEQSHLNPTHSIFRKDGIYLILNRYVYCQNLFYSWKTEQSHLNPTHSMILSYPRRRGLLSLMVMFPSVEEMCKRPSSPFVMVNLVASASMIASNDFRW